MFCVLEYDKKTFGYFSRYIDCFEDQGACLDVDNQIQVEEMEAHLKRHGFSMNDTQEKLNWIAINGKPFREYLNTIKLIYLVLRTQDIDPRTVDEVRFRQLEEKLNLLRHCMVSIF